MVAADDQQFLAGRGVPARRVVVHAPVAHVQALSRGPPPWMQSSYSVYAYDERARRSLFIGVRFSHDRRLEAFILVVFFLLVIIVVGISRRHLVADESEEAPVRLLLDVATMLPCEIAVGQTWSARWPHINSTSVRL
jgi:hypothetical protein